MSQLDWIVLLLSLVSIAGYGIYKSRGQKNMETYLKGDHSIPWFMVGLSIMATQASAITFLSAPGQAYTDGMRFVQYYFGLPIAMVVLSIFFLPIYHKLNVYTAYEFLESRFDQKTRVFTSLLFLTQRGLASGLTLYAPSLILSALLGWNIYYTNLFIGGIVIIYTVVGGSKAVSYTHLQQMTIIFIGMFLAGFMIVKLLPDNMGFTDAIKMGGKLGKMNVIDLTFDWNNKYNLWSGIIGGFFLALSYFGTDQSQVSRYISAKDLRQSRLGLIMNGFVKVPMQFLILLIGVLLFVFYQFKQAPVFFNNNETTKLENSIYKEEWKQIQEKNNTLFEQKKQDATLLQTSLKQGNEDAANQATAAINSLEKEQQALRKAATDLMKKNDPKAEINDTNYIFLRFVIDYLPHGLIGLLIAVIFAASMQSKSAELNALASCSIVDIYKRSFKKDGSEAHYLLASKISTALWGCYAIFVAMFANKLGSLIEAVNVLGSLFYGTILGIFLVAFFFKKLVGSSTFYAAVIAEIIVLLLYFYSDISFLWFNLVGSVLVIGFSFLIQLVLPKNNHAN
ncbi:MAG: sodium:solute symporter [Bacteroidia bacterium]|nr:sodium:solute symporter [Bacteroidia bacterium]MCF8426409.1 sodium:solute symporter [Bacteroidia bacterium]MCF8446177.1 sodium:solute symporter [Bacteroidia bacterium]